MSQRPDSPPITVTHRAEAERVVVNLGGELDYLSIDTVEAAIERLRPLPHPLAFELDDVTFLDSTGLRGLLRGHRASTEDTGVGATITTASRTVRSLLSLTGAAAMFGVDEPER
jgi:anti-anti-sigma factor